jgi:hypothetical protein
MHRGHAYASLDESRVNRPVAKWATTGWGGASRIVAPRLRHESGSRRRFRSFCAQPLPQVPSRSDRRAASIAKRTCHPDTMPPKFVTSRAQSALCASSSSRQRASPSSTAGSVESTMSVKRMVLSALSPAGRGRLPVGTPRPRQSRRQHHPPQSRSPDREPRRTWSPGCGGQRRGPPQAGRPDSRGDGRPESVR